MAGEVRHKKKLEQIRELRDERDEQNRIISNNIGGGSATPPGGELQPTQGSINGIDPHLAAGTQGIEGEPGAPGRSGSGDRSPESINERATSGIDQIAGAPGLSEPDEIERQKELNRQRQHRYRDRMRAAKVESSDTTMQDASDLSSDRYRYRDQKLTPNQVTARLKGMFAGNGDKEEIKLLTAKEADESLDKLVTLFTQGSALLDDVLEIIVLGHEKVKIWELDTAEATMLAQIQLEKAKKDKAAARVVRKLLEVYERMYLLVLVAPRLYATADHIKSHGGLGFK